MADNLNSQDRKKNMSNIRSKGNRSTEVRLRSSLVGSGISGFIMHTNSLPGKPDFVFKNEKLVVFVDGCFWHGCNTCYVRPKSNKKYWDKKLQTNIRRDSKINKQLQDLGWKTLRIWEHDLKNPQKAKSLVVENLTKSKL